MSKRPEIGPTVGKITYIYGGEAMQPNVIHDVHGPSAAVEPDWERWRAIDAERARSMTQQLDAAEQDISQHDYVFPPDGLRVRPDAVLDDYEPMPAAPSISVYGGSTPIYFDEHQKPQVDLHFGISDPHPYAWGDADELDIWASDQNPAPHQLPPVDFHAIVMAGLIILIMTFFAIGILNLFPTTTFAEFLAALPTPR